jgi:hypothetical protein
MELTTNRFGQDKRGAIMVLGIFFACVMIGWMWMLIGLGDAMIWRDRTQEAADAITYTSAAVQAKGMNFIAFINIVMLLIVAAYLAMAFIYNILDFGLVITGRHGDSDCPITWDILDSVDCHDGAKDVLGTLLSESGIGEILLAIDFEEGATVMQPIHDGLGKALDGYDKMMGTTLPILSDAEKLVAEVAPWAGAALGVLIGYRYEDWGKHRFGIGLSATLFPASKMPAPVKEWSNEDHKKPYTGRDTRLGLPVETKEMGRLCYQAAKTVIGGATSFLSSIPVIGTLVKMLTNALADKMEDWYCNKDEDPEGMFSPVDGAVADAWSLAGLGGPDPDYSKYDVKNGNKSIWTTKDGSGNPQWGPKEIVGYAENGNDWMQVWGVTYGGNRPEQAEKKVEIASFNWGGSANSDGGLSLNLSNILGGFKVYMAQAEFYYDCDKVWTDEEECNGTAEENYSTYNLNWRTRLRRVHGISWGKDLLNWAWNTSINDSFDTMAKKWVQNTGLFQTIQSAIGPFQANAYLDGAYADAKDFAGSQVSGMINPASVLQDTIH